MDVMRDSDGNQVLNLILMLILSQMVINVRIKNAEEKHLKPREA
jgi:hypothetical protein